MKKVLMVLLMMIIGLGGCKANDRESTLVVGMECGYAPHNWTQSSASSTSVQIDGGMHCDGYDVQIAKMIAEEMDRELVIKKITWDGLILSLQGNEIDLIIAGMSPTAIRKEEIDFSMKYYTDETGYGVVVSKNGPYASSETVDDFNGARMSAQIGTFHVDLLNQLEGVKQVANLKDFATMLVSLQSGEIDGFVADGNSAITMSNSNPDIVYIELKGERGYVLDDSMTGVSIGVKKGNSELLAKVNSILETISFDTQNQLMEDAISRSQE